MVITPHGDKETPEAIRSLMAMDTENFSTNETVMIPMISGEEKLACLWLGEVYNQTTVEAPTERPGKK